MPRRAPMPRGPREPSQIHGGSCSNRHGKAMLFRSASAVGLRVQSRSAVEDRHQERSPAPEPSGPRRTQEQQQQPPMQSGSSISSLRSPEKYANRRDQVTGQNQEA